MARLKDISLRRAFFFQQHALPLLHTIAQNQISVFQEERRMDTTHVNTQLLEVAFRIREMRGICGFS